MIARSFVPVRRRAFVTGALLFSSLGVPVATGCSSSPDAVETSDAKTSSVAPGPVDVEGVIGGGGCRVVGCTPTGNPCTENVCTQYGGTFICQLQNTPSGRSCQNPAACVTDGACNGAGACGAVEGGQGVCVDTGVGLEGRFLCECAYNACIGFAPGGGPSIYPDTRDCSLSYR